MIVGVAIIIPCTFVALIGIVRTRLRQPIVTMVDRRATRFTNADTTSNNKRLDHMHDPFAEEWEQIA